MEEGEQMRGEEMGLTVKQRQAVMNELRGQYLYAPPNEKSRILNGFVDLTHLNRSYARRTLRARATQGKGPVHRPRASVTTAAVLPALTEFWHLLDRLCGKRLVPFPLLGIHSDNGSEFMNNHLIRYPQQKHLTLTRFFLPVMQVTHKTRQGAKVTRSYDTPCSPYERILASPCITEEAKEALRRQYEHLDPVALHDTILDDQRHLRDLVLTKKQDRPHVIPRKVRDWQLHPVSSRF